MTLSRNQLSTIGLFIEGLISSNKYTSLEVVDLFDLIVQIEKFTSKETSEFEKLHNKKIEAIKKKIEEEFKDVDYSHKDALINMKLKYDEGYKKALEQRREFYSEDVKGKIPTKKIKGLKKYEGDTEIQLQNGNTVYVPLSEIYEFLVDHKIIDVK